MPAVPTPREQAQLPPQHVGSPYAEFDRHTWSRLRSNTPLTLTQGDLDRLSGLLDPVDLDEVEQVYLPLSRLLALYVAGAQGLHTAPSSFPRQAPDPTALRTR